MKKTRFGVIVGVLALALATGPISVMAATTTDTLDGADTTAVNYDVNGKLNGTDPYYVGKLQIDVEYTDFDYIYDLTSSTWTVDTKDFTITNNSKNTELIEKYDTATIDIAYTPDSGLESLAHGTIAIKQDTDTPASDLAKDYVIAKTYQYTLTIDNAMGTEEAEKVAANKLATERMIKEDFKKIGKLTIKYNDNH